MKQKQWKGSMLFVQHARRNIIGKHGLRITFHAWKTHAVTEKDARRKEHLITKVRLARLVSVLFSVWRRQSQVGMKETLIAHERAVADQVRAKIFEQMELERD